jgi:hypothetical protein
VNEGKPPQEAVLVEDVDGVPVGEARQEQRGEVGEGRLVVERRRELLAGLGQDGQP